MEVGQGQTTTLPASPQICLQDADIGATCCCDHDDIDMERAKGIGEGDAKVCDEPLSDLTSIGHREEGRCDGWHWQENTRC
jgi:hypothetical protein